MSNDVGKEMHSGNHMLNGPIKKPQTMSYQLNDSINKPPTSNYRLNIVHLYPDLLNLYGDRGNIQCLRMRCKWRGIDAQVTECNLEDHLSLASADIVLLGGGSDREQQIVCTRLQQVRPELRDYVEDGGTLIAICGGYQLLGHYYDTPEGRMKGLSLVDLYTEQGSPRLISNIVLRNESLPDAISGSSPRMLFPVHRQVYLPERCLLISLTLCLMRSSDLRITGEELTSVTICPSAKFCMVMATTERTPMKASSIAMLLALIFMDRFCPRILTSVIFFCREL